MNKKGFLKIVEATIAILIIAAAILIGLNNSKTTQDIDLSETARDILREIADNPQYRSNILNNNEIPQNIHNFVSSKLQGQLTYEIKLCIVEEVCGQSNYNGEVYSAERVISSDINNFSPKKIRLFIWRT